MTVAEKLKEYVETIADYIVYSLHETYATIELPNGQTMELPVINLVNACTAPYAEEALAAALYSTAENDYDYALDDLAGNPNGLWRETISIVVEKLIKPDEDGVGARIRELVEKLGIQQFMDGLEALMDDDQLALMQAVGDDIEELMEAFYEVAGDPLDEYLRDRAIEAALDKFYEAAQRRK